MTEITGQWLAQFRHVIGNRSGDRSIRQRHRFIVVGALPDDIRYRKLVGY
ncbi:MAG: hypothetical protein NT163_04895 [Chlorobiales bacterium]|nr:hypothetical protein [Chlorobiales bacterium]